MALDTATKGEPKGATKPKKRIKEDKSAALRNRAPGAARPRPVKASSTGDGTGSREKKGSTRKRLKVSDDDGVPSTLPAPWEGLWARICDGAAESRFTLEARLIPPADAFLHLPREEATRGGAGSPPDAASQEAPCGLQVVLDAAFCSSTVGHPSSGPHAEGCLFATPPPPDSSSSSSSSPPPRQEAGAPTVLLVSASATRCTELLRLARAACAAAQRAAGRAAPTPCAVAKLFAKHMKVEEQQAALRRPICVAAGTPNRLLKLLSLGCFRLSSLRLVLLDLAPSPKGLTLISLPDTKVDFQELFFKWLHPLLLTSAVRLAVCNQ